MYTKLNIVFLVLFSFLTSYAKVVETIRLNFNGSERPPKCLLAHKKLDRPKVGLALSGGGMRGAAQIGVLQILEQSSIPIDYIVGSSIGSVIGGLYASGYNAQEIWESFQALNISDLLVDAPKRSSQFLGQKQESQYIFQIRLNGLTPSLPQAFTPGQHFTAMLTNLLLNAPYHSKDFNHLVIPIRIITTDLLTGDKVVLSKGDLLLAMRASIAIPLLFSPVEYGDSLLVDGGLLDNIPVQETKDFGSDIVIAVNTTSPLRNKEDLKIPWKLADQVTTIMQFPYKKSQLEQADIKIDFLDIKTSSMDLDSVQFAKFYQAGKERTLTELSSIKSLLKQRRKMRCSGEKLNINKFVFGNLDASQLPNFKKTRYFDRNDIYHMLENFYNTGNYDNIYAEIRTDRQDTLVRFQYTPKPILNSVLFVGNTIFSDSLLSTFFNPLLGNKMNHYIGRNAIRNIIKLYRSEGYSLTNINDIIFDSKTGHLTIKISEGDISSVSFSGNEKTQTYVISREFNLKSGEIFQLEKAQRGINNIFATGLFQSVILKPIKKGKGWQIKLDLEENPSNVFRFGAQYNRERKGRTFLEFSDTNVFGTGNDLTFHGQYGNRDKMAGITFRSDRIFKSYLTSEVSVHYKLNSFYQYSHFKRIGEYERQASGIIGKLGQQIQRFGTIYPFIRIEKININGISGSGYDPGSLNVHTIGLTSLIDTRDRVPYPRNGKYHKFFYEVSSGKFLGADISFFKVLNQLSSYWTLWNRHTICPKITWGLSDLTTPFFEQFRIGGQDSFYGLWDGELMGRQIFLSNIEYIYRLGWKIPFETFISFRFDFGAAWEKVVDIKGEDFINGRGISLSMNTPLGPFRLAYGRSAYDQDKFYFSMGYDF